MLDLNPDGFHRIRTIYNHNRNVEVTKGDITPKFTTYSPIFMGLPVEPKLGYHPQMDPKIKGLKGFPLEYQMSRQGMSGSVTAAKVEEKKLDQSLFEVSDEYEEMDPALMERMMGGQ